MKTVYSLLCIIAAVGLNVGCQAADPLMLPSNHQSKRPVQKQNEPASTNTDDLNVSKRPIAVSQNTDCKNSKGESLELCDTAFTLTCEKFADGSEFCSQYVTDNKEGRIWGPY